MGAIPFHIYVSFIFNFRVRPTHCNSLCLHLVVDVGRKGSYRADVGENTHATVLSLTLSHSLLLASHQ